MQQTQEQEGRPSAAYDGTTEEKISTPKQDESSPIVAPADITTSNA